MSMKSFIRFAGLIVSSCTMCTGCIIIPLDAYRGESRENVKEEMMITLVLGTTTKEDVYLTLGEPDSVSPSGESLVYSWEKIKLIWIMVAAGGSAGAIISQEVRLILYFDDQGVLTKHELEKKFKTET